MLKSDEVIKYLKKRNINLTCRSCGNSEWTIFAESKGSNGDDDYAITGLVGLKLNDHGDVETTRLGGVGIVQIMCRKCGYMELYNYRYMRTYLEEMEKDEREGLLHSGQEEAKSE